MGNLSQSNKIGARERFTEGASLSRDGTPGIVPEKTFCRMLSLERKRAERSQKQFLLMLLEVGELHAEMNFQNHALFDKIFHVLLSSTRETDISGWYENPCTLGTILTEIPACNHITAVNAIVTKINAALLGSLSLSQVNKLRFSFHVFPEESSTQPPSSMSADLTLYPDLQLRAWSKRAPDLLKRSIDFAVSLVLLLLLSPVMALIALAIKLTSRGPVLFRQQRLGQYGRAFTFIKFRTMYMDSDSSVHREYAKRFISGTADVHTAGGNISSGVYKLTDDPRITRFGRLLRKTSLDELPQFLNVLTGQMSLVGPRPPIPYELASYATWHRRRILEAKPGITGLWQVSGRSRTKFDEMVRLDLEYARTRSIALDLRILLRTPRAVLSGEGAF